MTVSKSDVCRFFYKTPLLLIAGDKKFTSRPEVFLKLASEEVE